MNGITYFKLKSPYDGDVTKNCGLTGNEVDNNFFVLEGRDIKEVAVEGNALNITLMNGDVISDPDAFVNFTKDFDISFDGETGKLFVTYNGITKEMSIVIPQECPDPIVNVEQHSDITLTGDGSIASPFGVSPVYLPGRYRPVLKFIDETNGQTLPSDPAKGDRYLVKESVSAYGDLYNYDSVIRILCDLQSVSSEWRVPTKEDWDDMLNAIETQEEDRNHTDPSCNKYLGRLAGKFLKSSHFWKANTTSVSGDDMTGDGTSSSDNSGSSTSSSSCGCPCCGNNTTNMNCNGTFYGASGCCNMCTDSANTAGIDKFGFNVIPSGYADDGSLYAYLTERGAFWTATKMEGCASAYMKRFEYNKNTVFQDIISTNYYLSLRLVKDYTGDNFYGRETILGDSYDTMLMPSLSSGNKVWTAVNVAFTGNRYNAITPNVGEDQTVVTRYFIAEWDGTRWLTNNFEEGEIVVIMDAPDGTYATDYKLVHGELVSLNQQLTENFLDNVNDRLDTIEGKVDSEIERATTVENALSEKLTNTTNLLESALVGAGLSTEDGTYQPNTEGEYISDATSLSNADSLLDAALKAEKEAREAADQEILDNLNSTSQEISDDMIADGEFDAENGILTLYKKNEENDPINIQFSFNFGDIDDMAI